MSLWKFPSPLAEARALLPCVRHHGVQATRDLIAVSRLDGFHLYQWAADSSVRRRHVELVITWRGEVLAEFDRLVALQELSHGTAVSLVPSNVRDLVAGEDSREELREGAAAAVACAG